MEIQIENLKAKMRGVELNSYQKGLALDEFEKLIAHTEALEQQLHQYNVSGQREQCAHESSKISDDATCWVCSDCGARY